ncbi:MAG: response regulator, partial [Mariprofundaceae bacterium]
HPEIIVNGDASMIQQVLLNLMSNARDALAETKGARIVMALEPVSMNDGVYKSHAELQGKPLVCLSVSDNGCGIPDSLQSAIFDPFFTTKEVGKGTGLGLAMVYGAMQTHGGAVTLHSELGRGTEFRLYFPRLDEVMCEVEQEKAEVVDGDGIGVLVADDEPEFREVLSEALGDIGYRVFSAADGEQAVALFEQHREDIGIAILDVVMPNMGGPEACLRLREIDPDLPVLFHTGYGQNVLVGDAMVQPLIESITKPASIEQLAGKLAYLLHLKQAPGNKS